MLKWKTAAFNVQNEREKKVKFPNQMRAELGAELKSNDRMNLAKLSWYQNWIKQQLGGS